MKKTLMIILGVMGVAGLTQVQAQLLNVNFQDDSINNDYGGGNNPAPATTVMSGAAAIGSPGDIWNGLHGFNYTPYPDGATYTSGSLTYANGYASGITLFLYAPTGTYDANSQNWGNYSPFSWASDAAETAGTGYPYTPYAALMASCLVANTSSANGFVTLSGLSPNAIYNLYTYSASDPGSDGRTSTFIVNGVTQACTYNLATNLVLGVDYLEFAGVQASASGTLTIDFGDEIASESDFNGFQLQFVSGTAPAVFPNLTPISLNALTLCTNTTLTVTATVPGTNSISSFEVIIATNQLGSPIITSVTNTYTANSSIVSGLNTASAVINIPLSSNFIYTVTVSATDNTARSTTVSGSFDTLAPTLVIEATDFNFNGGQYIDTPANGGVYLYAGVQGNDDIDANKTCSNPSTSVTYRNDPSLAVIQDAGSTTFNEQKYVVAGDQEYVIDYGCTGDWFDYTRTYGTAPTDSAPAGTYDVWLCMANDNSGIQSSLYQIVGDPTSSTQATNFLGYFGTASFSEQNWAGYEYVPLTDEFGNLVSATIASGPQTLRISQVENPNLAFLMLMPVTPKYTPSLLFDYPDGIHPMEPTNHLTFTVGPANGSNITSSGIHLVLNGVDVTSSPGFSLTPVGNEWIVSFPIRSNAIYTAALNVTNTAGLYSVFPVNFDTFNPNNYQWEANDYDFTTNSVSGLFIDNPVPTGDTTLNAFVFATNSYFGYPEDLIGQSAALQGVDVGWVNVSGQQTAYREDIVGSQVALDYVRPKFVAAQAEFGDPNIGPFNVGWYTTGSWLNYTHTYPTNNWYIWGRLAGGGGPFSGTTLSILTSGYGTSLQTSNVLGSFADPNAAGWQTWHWIPLLDGNGNKVAVPLGGMATLQVTSGNNVNMEFFMLVPAPSRFALTASLVAGQIDLSFPTQVGFTYTVLFTPSLTAPNWTPVGSPITGDGTVHVVPESLGGTQGYFTVSVQ